MGGAYALAPTPPGSGLRAVPGDPGAPVVGHLLRYLRDPVRWAAGRYERYGPVSWSRAFGVRLDTALTPEAAGPVLAGGWNSHAIR